MTRLRSVVRGCGSYLPRTTVTNDDLAARSTPRTSGSSSAPASASATSPRPTRPPRARHQGGRTRLAGCRHRRLDHRPRDLRHLDAGPHLPSTATQIQAGLGIQSGAAFDLQAVCAGFVYAVATADKFLVTGAATLAPRRRRRDLFRACSTGRNRNTCVLFGDGSRRPGAGSQPVEGHSGERGVQTSQLRADGRHREKLYVDGGPGSTGTTGKLRMVGKEVFRFGRGSVTDVIAQAFAAHRHHRRRTLDWFVPKNHQPTAASSSRPRPTSSASPARRWC